jgi:hypothetical protein
VAVTLVPTPRQPNREKKNLFHVCGSLMIARGTSCCCQLRTSSTQPLHRQQVRFIARELEEGAATIACHRPARVKIYMRIVIADADSRRRASVTSSLPPNIRAVECTTLRTLKRALDGSTPAAVVVGPLPGGQRSALAAIHCAQATDAAVRIFYLADALPGMLPSGSSGKVAEYLPPLISGPEIAAVVCESLGSPPAGSTS